MYSRGRKQKDIGLTRYPSLTTSIWPLGERKGVFSSLVRESYSTREAEKPGCNEPRPRQRHMYVSSNIEIQRHIDRHCKAVLPHWFPYF